MSSVQERLTLFAICFVISLPISYIVLINCVSTQPRIGFNNNNNNNNNNEVSNTQKIESKNENEIKDTIV